RGIAGFVFSDGGKPVGRLDKVMRRSGIVGATPHDLRRTHGTMITRLLGFGGTDAMNRIQNHKTGGIGSVYDQHAYADENKQIMERAADRIMALARGQGSGVVELHRGGVQKSFEKFAQ